MVVYFTQVVDALNQLLKELIIKSFKNFTLTIALNGFEDNQIHCFKANRLTLKGFQLLQETRLDEFDNEMAQ